MTKRVVIENGDDSDYDLLVDWNDRVTSIITIVPPNRSHEVWIHGGIVLNITEQDLSEDSRNLGVRLKE